jgi:hypothetical protein
LAVDALVTRLTRETGITEPQARDLISLLGVSWPSLVREANIISKSTKARSRER